MRLLAVARSANLYHVILDDRPIATLHLKAGGVSRAELADGGGLLIRRDGPLGARFTITRDPPDPAGAAPGEPLLRAHRPNPLRRVYEIGVTGRQITLRAESPRRGDYLILERGEVTGAIRQSAHGRDAAADLPTGLPLEAGVSLLCLVLTLWRQGHARVDTL